MSSPGRLRPCRTVQPGSAPAEAEGGQGRVKYFIKGKMPEGWCALTYPAAAFRWGCLSRSTRSLPGGPAQRRRLADLYNIFLEPATASFDRLDLARVRGECSIVKAGAT